MIVGDDQPDIGPARPQDGRRFHARGGGQHIAAPAAQQARHAFQNGRFVVDHQHRFRQRRNIRPAAPRRLLRPRRAALARGWQIDGEHRAFTGRRFQRQRAVQNARYALDDGQPQPQPRLLAAVLAQPREFAEHHFALVLRDARAGVKYGHAHAASAPAAAHEHLARSGILDGVGEKILQQSAQQPPVRAHPGRTRHGAQLQPLGARQRGHFARQRQQDVVERKVRVFGFARARVEA